MHSEVLVDDLSLALDTIVADVLVRAGILSPPVDALAVADSLGMKVIWDDRQAGRARVARVPGADAPAQAAIMVRHDPRPERLQWAVAHEIGEQLAQRAFAMLDDDARGGSADREEMANRLAGRVLLPTDWLTADAQECDWDLFSLKQRYETASHELIARRSLEFQTSIIVTVIDNGRITWRRSNFGSHAAPFAGAERRCWRQAQDDGAPCALGGPGYRVRAWPVHEPNWSRQVVRTELDLDAAAGVHDYF